MVMRTNREDELVRHGDGVPSGQLRHPQSIVLRSRLQRTLLLPGINRVSGVRTPASANGKIFGNRFDLYRASCPDSISTGHDSTSPSPADSSVPQKHHLRDQVPSQASYCAFSLSPSNGSEHRTTIP